MTGPLALLLLSPLWGGLDAGPYDVGFEAVSIRDYARPFRDRGDDRVRAVRVGVWYPARIEAQKEPLPFGFYVSREERGALQRWLDATGDRDALAGLLETTAAAYDAPLRAQGSFPVVLFGGGIEAPMSLNAALCELLASHGYVAVAVPSLPARDGRPQVYDAVTVETLIRDLELVIHELRDYPGADIERLGLVGWGLSSVGHVLLQMKNPDVAAVVSLDGATGYRYGHELLTSSIWFDPSRTRAAFLHATDSRDETRHRPKSFVYFDSIHRGSHFLLGIQGAAPADFTTVGAAPHVDTPSREHYRIACEYVRRFLDLAMNENTDAAEFFEVTPARHGFEGTILSKRP